MSGAICPTDQHRWGQWSATIPGFVHIGNGILDHPGLAAGLPIDFRPEAQHWRRTCATCGTAQEIRPQVPRFDGPQTTDGAPVTSPARGGPDTAGRGEMAIVLASHRLTTPRQCFCGEREFFEDGLHRPEWHVAHVLTALLPVVQLLAAEKAAEVVEALRPHIPPSTDPNRRTAVIVRSTLNQAARAVRADALAAAAQPIDGRTGA